MAVRIGINPITWTNDDMEWLGDDIPLEVSLAEARQAGYAGIELGRKFPRRAAELRPILDRHGLRLVSGWYPARLLERSVAEEIDAVADHLELLREMGCAVMVFADETRCNREVGASRRPRLAEAEWPEFCARLALVARHLQDAGVRLAFHHHMDTVVQTEPEIDRLMAATGPEVGLLLDTGHLVYAGGDPVAVAKRHAGRIIHVHCKDIRRPVLDQALEVDATFRQATLDGIFTVPGDGCVPFAEVLPILAAAGYAGWLVVEAEQDPAKAHPLTYARMGFEHISALAPRAGFTIADQEAWPALLVTLPPRQVPSASASSPFTAWNVMNGRRRRRSRPPTRPSAASRVRSRIRQHALPVIGHSLASAG